MRDYFVAQMFMCFHRCSCVEPSDPSNSTLKYWETNNITASEIYWEALEVKVSNKLPLINKRGSVSHPFTFFMHRTAEIICLDRGGQAEKTYLGCFPLSGMLSRWSRPKGGD